MTKVEFIKQWEAVSKVKIFEIPVLNKESNKTDYIIFNIELSGDCFVASHVALTTTEQNSHFVAYKSIEVDYDFSLDENLGELYDVCLDAVINSDFYTLN